MEDPSPENLVKGFLFYEGFRLICGDSHRFVHHNDWHQLYFVAII